MMGQFGTTSQELRKAKTKCKIQLGGLLQKSGLMDVFNIAPEDNLQDNSNLEKASQLLGFLITCFEEKSFDEKSLAEWRALGKSRLGTGK